MTKLITIKECAIQYGISRSTIYRMFESGQLHKVKFGKAARIKIEEMEELVEKFSSPNIAND